MCPAVTAADYARALANAQLQIRRRCRTQAQRDAATDATTDAILRAARQYDPAAGTWRTWVDAAISLAVTSVMCGDRHDRLDRRSAVPLSEPVGPGDGDGLVSTVTALEHVLPHPPAADPAGHFRDLPADLRHVCTLYIIHGYTADETAELSGVARDVLRRRLREAARIVRRQQSCRTFRPHPAE